MYFYGIVRMSMKRRAPYVRKQKDNSIAKTRKDVNQDKRLNKVEKKVKQIENEVELKYFDVIAASPATAAGLLTTVNSPATGTSQITRIGAQIRMTSIQYRYILSNLATTLGPTVCRFMVVLDKQVNGIAATVSASGSAGTPAILESQVITSLVDEPYQYESKERFQILFDKRYVFNPQQDLTTAAGTVTVNQIVSKQISGYIKLNRMVKFDATNNNVASINKNALYTLFITDVANGITITGGTRMYFKDA